MKGLSAMRVMAAPPPRLPRLGVDIYLIPCISNASSTLFLWATLEPSSQISLWRPRCISFSNSSSIRLKNFGKRERWLVTMILGKVWAPIALLFRFTVVRHGGRIAGLGGWYLELGGLPTMTGIGYTVVCRSVSSKGS